MIDPKKRIKEILFDEILVEGYGGYCRKDYEEEMTQLANKILKEFVHKDNLPSEDEIENLLKGKNGLFLATFLDKRNQTRIKFEFYLKNRAKAIRKLIEGKK